MREALNSNPLAQLGLVAALLLAAGFFVLSSMGGGEEEAESGVSEGTLSISGTSVTPPASSVAPTSVPPLPPAAAVEAPPLPSAVTAAFDADRIVVLLFVRNGGIDDRMVAAAVEGLASLPDVASFVVPAGRIARYAAIAQGVAVDRVPALVVVRPKRLAQQIPTASVHYGFQSSETIRQAVIDAGYEGRTLDYHP